MDSDEVDARADSVRGIKPCNSSPRAVGTTGRVEDIDATLRFRLLILLLIRRGALWSLQSAVRAKYGCEAASLDARALVAMPVEERVRKPSKVWSTKRAS